MINKNLTPGEPPDNQISSLGAGPGKQWYCSPISRHHKDLISSFIEKHDNWEGDEISPGKAQALVLYDVLTYMVTHDDRYQYLFNLDELQP